jgi:hypothetical protein
MRRPKRYFRFHATGAGLDRFGLALILLDDAR